MYLKSIELTGFKSFGKKTSLVFKSSIAAIVGPNGSGKCVAPDTLVQLANGERAAIQELFDRAHATARRIRTYDDGMAVMSSDFSVDVMSLDTERQKIIARPVSAFIRRRAPSSTITITLHSGRKITATPYHPVFVLENAGIKPVRTDALKKGTRIAVPRSIPVGGSLQRLSMLKVAASFESGDNIYVPYAQSVVDLFIYQAHGRSAVRSSKAFSVGSEVIKRWFDGQSLPTNAASRMFAGQDENKWFPDRILKSRTRGTMRVPEYVDENVARFLGYLIAEGRNASNGQIRFVNDDRALVDDFISCAWQSFGVSTTVRSYKGHGILDAFISSMTLSRFLGRIFGVAQEGHSRDKSTPSLILASPNNIVAAFLSALFEGDAYFHVESPDSRANYLEYATASERLAREVHSLLLRFDIRSDVRAKLKYATNGRKEKREYWSVFVYGNAQLRALASFLTLRGRKAAALSRFRDLPRRENPNHDLIPGGAALVRDAARAAAVSVKRLRVEYPTLAAYCEGRCESSRPGIRRCIEALERRGNGSERAKMALHTLRTLATSDVQWDEIISIEHKTGRGFVYDLTVVGDHNFIADDIFVHNSNVAEGFRFVLGEQSMKSLRSKRGEDLIWGGSPALARSNRAAVKVVFDNSKRLLDIDFQEVVIERVVHRDGQNEYMLNGTQVRLKDVIRLLAGANIGGSGYQIISQGEADRILNASPRERREMVEDALGLKLYQHKKAESERKLDETGVNIEKTRSLRREIAPHLNFLRSQVSKIEKAREMKDELAHKLSDYLAREHAWISQEDARLSEDARSEEAALKALSGRVAEARGRRASGKDSVITELQTKIAERERKLSEARRESERLARELGRAEGAAQVSNVTVEQIVPVPHVRQFARELFESLGDAEREDDIQSLKRAIALMRDKIRSFIEGLSGTAPETNEEVRRQVVSLAASLERVRAEESSLAGELEALRAKIAQVREEGFEAERDLVELEASVREAQGRLSAAQSTRSNLAALRQRFEEEVREGVALVGPSIRGWDGAVIPEGALSEPREAQEKRRRDIERLKIKIEESGIGNGETVVREFNQTKERDEHLGKELEDLERSAASLKEIIAELEETIDARFTEGLTHINEALKDFFTKLFGGGEAKLEIEAPRLRRKSAYPDEDDEEEIVEEEELYAGLSIYVSLPRKKIKGLEVLSGGERALTSIALIFSMSQVNPPPFLVLDETDAALDEANSKRYADMIRELGKKSQLIVITHNRATMAAAGELYGVTMGSDGVSKLLSVQLEEAEKVGK